MARQRSTKYLRSLTRLAPASGDGKISSSTSLEDPLSISNSSIAPSSPLSISMHSGSSSPLEMKLLSLSMQQASSSLSPSSSSSSLMVGDLRGPGVFSGEGLLTGAAWTGAAMPGSGLDIMGFFSSFTSGFCSGFASRLTFSSSAFSSAFAFLSCSFSSHSTIMGSLLSSISRILPSCPMVLERMNGSSVKQRQDWTVARCQHFPSKTLSSFSSNQSL
mmetsp:Transcript_65632/g.171973  ORF Transcript_65632/g.171973 Transcript_65632/m.171973 type:complete len:218 (+) Transcript_65632:365-1018(+)